MSFIPQAFDKSVFNKSSYNAAIGKNGKNGYAVVTITPKYNRLSKDVQDPSIKGVYDDSSGGLSFNINAEWTDLGGIAGSIFPARSNAVQGMFKKANDVSNLLGAGRFGVSYASKLIYQNSGHLEIKVPMMIVDWNGTGQPLACATLLSYYCLPQKIVNLEEEIKETLTEVEQELHKTAQDGDNLFERAVAGGVLFAKETAEGVVKKGSEYAASISDKLASKSEVYAATVKGGKQAAGFAADRAAQQSEGIEDIYTLRSSPSPVIVEIGEYFKNSDMVIENVDFEFSKEMTRSGPLFVKANLRLKSRRILTDVESIGLIPTEKISRYIESETPLDATGL